MILFPDIANGRLTNIPSDESNSKRSSSVRSSNLFFKSNSRYLAPCVLNNFLVSTPVFSTISLNSFFVGVC